MLKKFKWWLWDSGKDWKPEPKEQWNFIIGLYTGVILATGLWILGSALARLI